MLDDIALSYVGGQLYTPYPLNVQGTLFAQSGAPQPSDHGLIAWSSDPASASAAVSVSSGVMYLVAVYLRAPCTVSKVWYGVAAAAVTPTATESNIGFYSQAGTLLGSANIDAAMTPGSTPEGVSLGSPVTVSTAGLYYVGFEIVAATQPTFYCANASVVGDRLLSSVNLSGSTLRYATNGASKTALPSPVTTSANTTTNSEPWWVAVS